MFRSKGDVDGANDAYCRALDHLRKAMPPLDEIERVVAAEESEAFEREADANVELDAARAAEPKKPEQPAWTTRRACWAPLGS